MQLKNLVEDGGIRYLSVILSCNLKIYYNGRFKEIRATYQIA